MQPPMALHATASPVDVQLLLENYEKLDGEILELYKKVDGKAGRYSYIALLNEYAYCQFDSYSLWEYVLEIQPLFAN